MSGQAADSESQPAPAMSRVFHVTVSDQRPDGALKTFTMLALTSTSHDAAMASLKARFGAEQIVSIN